MVRMAPIENLSNDIQYRILSYLWYIDVGRVSLASRHFRNVASSHIVQAKLLCRLLSISSHQISDRKCDNDGAESDDEAFLSKLSKLRPDHFPLIAERVNDWPHFMVADEMLDTYDIEIESPSPSRCVGYQGRGLGGDRTVVADGHFPCLYDPKLSHYSITRSLTADTGRINPLSAINYSSVPFVKVCVSAADNSPILTLSNIAYYEVKIHEPILPQAWRKNRRLIYHQQHSSCVAVGIANTQFPLYGKMPGWDSNSYGYHSDDGNFFHSTSMGSEFGPRFGSGDVVGCGIIYPEAEGRSGHLFFTLNGKRLREFCEIKYAGMLSPWFPAVGLDSYSPVEVNFGSKPFLYSPEDDEEISESYWSSVRVECEIEEERDGIKDRRGNKNDENSSSSSSLSHPSPSMRSEPFTLKCHSVQRKGTEVDEPAGEPPVDPNSIWITILRERRRLQSDTVLYNNSFACPSRRFFAHEPQSILKKFSDPRIRREGLIAANGWSPWRLQRPEEEEVNDDSGDDEDWETLSEDEGGSIDSDENEDEFEDASDDFEGEEENEVEGMIEVREVEDEGNNAVSQNYIDGSVALAEGQRRDEEDIDSHEVSAHDMEFFDADGQSLSEDEKQDEESSSSVNTSDPVKVIDDHS